MVINKFLKFVKRNKILLFIIVGVIWVISMGTFQSIRLHREAKSGYPVFNSKKIEGKILKYGVSGGLYFIKISNIDEELTFSPITLEIDSGKSFFDIAKPGDSILKKAYGDTIILIHDGEKYYYLFDEFE